MSSFFQTLSDLGDPKRAQKSMRYFKATPDARIDRFWGIRVPTLRVLAAEHHPIPWSDLTALLASDYHEARHLAAIALVLRYQKIKSDRSACHSFYLEHLDGFDNWDLVDCSAPTLLGRHLENQPADLLFQLAHSPNFWHRRMAMAACEYEIRKRKFDRALALAALLRADPADLVQKAVGWMVREVGNRNMPAACAFLDEHAPHMARTSLRYALEKFPPELRLQYMKA